MFIPREGLPCERQLLSWCQHLSIISSRFISEKTKPPVCCASTQQDSACPTNTKKGSGCLTVTAGIKAEGVAHAHQATGASSSCQCPGPPCQVSTLESWVVPSGSPCLVSALESWVVPSGPPCLVSTLELWVVPVGLPVRCPLWSHGWYPWASLPGVHSGVMGTWPDGDWGSPDYYIQISKRQAQGRGSDQIPYVLGGRITSGSSFR